jgi:preprotein translocase subunit SecG
METAEPHIQTQARLSTIITLLVYVAFFALYIFITGTLTDDTVQFGFRDPVAYIIAAFLLYALVMLHRSAWCGISAWKSPTMPSFIRSRFFERSIRFCGHRTESRFAARPAQIQRRYLRRPQAACVRPAPKNALALRQLRASSPNCISCSRR